MATDPNDGWTIEETGPLRLPTDSTPRWATVERLDDDRLTFTRMGLFTSTVTVAQAVTLAMDIGKVVLGSLGPVDQYLAVANRLDDPEPAEAIQDLVAALVQARATVAKLEAEEGELRRHLESRHQKLRTAIQQQRSFLRERDVASEALSAVLESTSDEYLTPAQQTYIQAWQSMYEPAVPLVDRIAKAISERADEISDVITSLGQEDVQRLSLKIAGVVVQVLRRLT